MLNRLQHILKNKNSSHILFYILGAVILLSLFLAVIFNTIYLAAFPAILLLGFLTIVDFRSVFYLLLFCIPLSTEMTLPNGFGTDLPTEPLMIGLMGVYLLYILSRGAKLQTQLLTHPVTLLLLLHIGWTVIATITSAQVFISLKFVLAKFWYVITFYFLAAHLIKDTKTVSKIAWIIFIPLTFTIITTIVRHKGYDFSFEMVHKVLHPFYRNHVAYAAIIVVFSPFLWLLWRRTPQFSQQWWWLTAALGLFIIGVQFSYTRAAYGAVIIAIGAYFVIQRRLTKVVLALSLAGVIALVTFLATDNKYLDFAPDFERTITHTDFDNLLEATYQMQDISTMERVYRWVAAAFMIKERPVFGFGPGNFFFYYKSYTVTSFKTYVSDNPEGSGIHSYYIMVLVEQGLPGLLFFLLIVFYALIRGEHIYHHLRDPKDKLVVMAAMLSLIIILALLVINDLIETDKIGPFFFINLALIVNMDLKLRQEAWSNVQ